MTRASNHAIAGARFYRRFGRWPVPPEDARATINDVIFARAIDPLWSPLERAFVDKETAKAEARRLDPGLRAPETIAIISMADIACPADLAAALRPFFGTPAIAKPTHASGAVTVLRHGADEAAMATLFDLASRDYAAALREMQYWRLPRKIIVEAEIAARGSGPPDDYKFHCIDGRPIVCQIDHGRFGSPWSRLFSLPDFTAMDPDDGLVAPASLVPAAPDRLARMAAAARALSAPFRFARVDLYDGADGITFGEVTFTPAASLGIAPSARGDHAVTETHRRYSDLMMAALRGQSDWPPPRLPST